VQSSKNSFFSAQEPIELKSSSELEKLRTAGKAVARVLQMLAEQLRPGISTQYLDDLAYKEICSLNMKPAFLGYRGYPATTCISINQELVHGIPRKDKIIKEGDIVSIDFGVINQGFYGDAAATYGVGKISPEAEHLLNVTRESLERAIEQVKPGNRLGDVSWAIQQYIEKAGLSVVREWTGHGIGRKMHEEPSITNFGRPGTGPRLLPGMVLCIEPMANLGDWRTKILSDGWTVVTIDGKLCAHFEHMIAVTEDGHEVLTKM
jgi:methionyl aminopeptidase